MAAASMLGQPLHFTVWRSSTAPCLEFVFLSLNSHPADCANTISTPYLYLQLGLCKSSQIDPCSPVASCAGPTRRRARVALAPGVFWTAPKGSPSSFRPALFLATAEVCVVPQWSFGSRAATQTAIWLGGGWKCLDLTLWRRSLGFPCHAAAAASPPRAWETCCTCPARSGQVRRPGALSCSPVVQDSNLSGAPAR